MSSLEDEIFFGSKQNILDSYLRAREEQRDDSDLPKKRAVIYPNILDDISYQPSFDKPDRPDISNNFSNKPNIIIKSRNPTRLNDTVFVGLRNVRLQSDTLNEGICIELKVQLGDNSMNELFFFSSTSAVDVNDCLKISLNNCSLEDYFTR